MAFEEVEKGSCKLEETYPKFDELGDYVEGNLYGFEDGDFGKQIVLYLGDDEYDEPILQILPSHKSLKKFYSNLEIGDYIKVELVKIVPAKSEGYGDIKFYKVYKDPERAVEFDNEEGVEDE